MSQEKLDKVAESISWPTLDAKEFDKASDDRREESDVKDTFKKLQQRIQDVLCILQTLVQPLKTDDSKHGKEHRRQVGWLFKVLLNQIPAYVEDGKEEHSQDIEDQLENLMDRIEEELNRGEKNSFVTSKSSVQES